MEYIPVQLLHPLEVWESTDEDGKLLRRVNLNNFVSYLRGNRSPNDRIPLRQDKIWDEAQRHSEYWILQSDNSRWISLSFVITYMCRHAGDFVVCRNFAGDLEELIIGQPINASKGNTCAEVPETVLHLYKDIAKHGLKRESVENHFLTHLTLHFQSSTLIVDHKKHFSDNEWKLISLFELHFASEHDCDSMDYKELLEVRWKYLKKLRDIRNLGTNMNTLCRSSVAENAQRQALAAKLNGMVLEANGKHIPSVIDACIVECNIAGINAVTSVDCIQPCNGNGLHVYLELMEGIAELPDGNDVLPLITGPMHRRHNAHCCTIVVFAYGTFDKFTKSDGSIQRFLMRDIFMQGGLEERITSVIKNTIELCDDLQVPHCDSCFPAGILPLDWRQFDIMQEWQIGIPLPMQLLLESFLNQETLSKTEDVQKYLQSKVSKLHTNFDGLISVHNRKYSGVLQDLNTKELAMKYHSISSLFAITSKTGATQSLRTAERLLKQEADSDLCYFNTYLKKYPMRYTSSAGDICQEISMRDCHLIIGLDNLVRLTFHQDPMPGQSRSHQVCTLPITISGVPKDAFITLSWHSEHCDGLAECNCMDMQSLKPDDHKRVIFEPSIAEKDALQRFHKLSTWGLKFGWDLFESGKICILSMHTHYAMI